MTVGESRTSRRLGVLSLAVLLTASLPLAAQSDSPQERIRAHRKTLLGPDPAPEGSQDRVLAVAQLVRMDEPEAHVLLREVLDAYPDAARAPASTITKLLEVLTQEQAIDLESKRLVEIDKDPRVRRRLGIYAGYARSMVRLASVLDASDERLAAGLNQVRLFFLTLPGDTRRPALKELATQGPDALRVAAIGIAGETRDPKLAVDLAPLLGQSALRKPVQDALANLTLRVETFASQTDFDAWWQANGGKSYQQLMLEAAREGRDIARKLEARHEEARQKLVAKLAERSKLIFTLGIRQPSPPWNQFLLELQDADLRPHWADLLDILYRGLRAQPLDAKAVQQSRVELAALREHLRRGYDAAPRGERESWLAAHAACSVALGSPAAEEVQAALLDLLANGETVPPVALARVLELLTMFKEDRVRARVLDRLERADAAPHLKVGLGCLRDLGPATDESTVERTLDLLVRCVRDAQLPGDVRELALDVLGGVDTVRVVPRLRELVTAMSPVPLPETLRATALAWLRTKVESLLQARAGSDHEAVASEYVEFLIACLTDEAPRIRQESLRALENFPPTGVAAAFSDTFRDKLAKWIVVAAGSRLRPEKVSACVRALRAVLAAQAARAAVADVAVTHLVLALVQWSQADNGNGTPNGLLAEHLPGIESELVKLLPGKEIQAEATLLLARDLVEARLLPTAALLLMAPCLVRVDLPPDSSSPSEVEATTLDRLRRERAKLVLRIADGLGDADKLDDAIRARLDALLVASANGIQTIGAESPPLLVALGRAQLAAGQAEAAGRVLDGFLKQYGKDAPAPLAGQARRLLAQSLSRCGKPADGARVLEGLADPDAQLLRGQLLVEASVFVEAEKVFRTLLDGGELGGDPTRREHAQLGWAEALIKQSKLSEAASLLDALPALTDKAAGDKLLVLRQELKARQEEARKNGSGGPSGQSEPSAASSGKPATPPNGR